MKKMIYFKEEHNELIKEAITWANTKKALTGGSLSSFISISLERFMIENGYSESTYFPFTPQTIELITEQGLERKVFYGYLLISDFIKKSETRMEYQYLFLTKKKNLLLYQKEIIDGKENGRYFVYSKIEDIPKEFHHLAEKVENKLRQATATFLDV